MSTLSLTRGASSCLPDLFLGGITGEAPETARGDTVPNTYHEFMRSGGSLVDAVARTMKEPTWLPARVGPFVAAVARGAVPSIEWLVDHAEPDDLRLMAKELLQALDASCRTLAFDDLARLYLDWIATLEVSIGDKDKSLLHACSELRRVRKPLLERGQTDDAPASGV